MGIERARSERAGCRRSPIESGIGKGAHCVCRRQARSQINLGAGDGGRRWEFAEDLRHDAVIPRRDRIDRKGAKREVLSKGLIGAGL